MMVREQNRTYYPLTHPQLAIWQTEKFHAGTGFGNICSSTIIAGEVDFNALHAAIRWAIEANDGVRLRMEEINGLPQQYLTTCNETDIDHFDFDPAGGKEDFCQWLDDQNKVNFKLTDSSLCYFATFKIGNGERGFYVRAHHLICDGWAMVWLSGKIVECYTAIRNGIPFSTGTNPSYLDYAAGEQAYLESERFQKQKEYWANRFATVPEFTVMIPHSAGPGSTTAVRETFNVTAGLSESITAFSVAAQVSPFIVFMAALYVYVHKVTSASDIVIGTPVLNRSNAREKETFGMFISMVPFRLSVDHTVTFGEFVQGISREWRSVLKNQKYSYDRILKDYREAHGTKDMLFDIVMSYQNASATTDRQVAEHRILWHHNGHQTETLAIHINDRNNTGSYEIQFDYLSDRLTEADVRRMWEHISNLLKEAVIQPDRQLNELEMLSMDEKFRVVHDFNRTASEYPRDTTIHRLFEEQTVRTPLNIAVVDGCEEITYIELNRRSELLAKALRNHGVGSGSVAAVLMEPSMEMVVGILGILKAGGAYVPMDTDYPEERIRYMLADSGSVLMIGDRPCRAYDNLIPSFTVSELLESMDVSNQAAERNNPEDAAYIIYTSGSTGKPKGVVVEHRSLINLCWWHNRRFGITENDRATKYAGAGFDASVWEMFPYLVSGAALHIIGKALRYDIPALNRYFNHHGITVSFLPTQICERFMELENHSLRYLLTGADKLNKFISNPYILVNNYGPTESTVVTTSFDVDKSYGNIPIGRPIDNTRVYILDKSLRVQPIGIPGELYIAGDGLAREYIGNRVRTDEKFVDGSTVGEVRMYRSGDLARWLPDGNIEFLGRADNQIKIRGCRIEIGEIEVNILSMPGVLQTVVEVVDGDNGHRYLCAYYVADRMLSPADLKAFLISRLPDYMVPQLCVPIDSIPLTANGKIDHSKLPEITVRTEIEGSVSMPESAIEAIIIETAEKIYGNGRIGTNQNLVNMGFDSLMLIQLVAELEWAGLSIPIQDFYENLTVRDMAQRIEGSKSAESSELTYEGQEKVDICSPYDIAVDGHESMNHILLTGSTGFLGIHLLRNLLQDTDARITCLVRGTDRSHGEERLGESLRKYFPYLPLERYNERMDVVCGDISDPLLGLTEGEYRLLGDRLDSVINPAANVKHYGSYTLFESSNVSGVKNLLTFCEAYGLRLNHISTVSISGNYALQKRSDLCFSEKDLFIGQDISDNPYVKSKFEGEKLIAEAVHRGVTCSVYRVGNLTGRYDDGRFQWNISDNRFYNFLRTVLMTGTIPESMLGQEIDLTPVDQCSQAIVMLASRIRGRNQRYHLYNSRVIPIRRLSSFMISLGYDVRPLKDGDFIENLNRLSRETGDFEMLKGFIGLTRGSDQLDRRHPVAVSSDITEEYLEGQGFRWAEIDCAYLERVIRHARNVGFINNTKIAEVLQNE